MEGTTEGRRQSYKKLSPADPEQALKPRCTRLCDNRSFVLSRLFCSLTKRLQPQSPKPDRREGSPKLLAKKAN